MGKDTSAITMPSSALIFALQLFLLADAATASNSETAQILGVSYGTLGHDLPAPRRALELARSAGAVAVRFYDSNATVLAAAASSGLAFVPGVPNELIPSLSASRPAADAWVASTLVPFRSNRNLRYLLVGHEVLSDSTSVGRPRWFQLVRAMVNLRGALRRHGLRRVKVSTTLGMDALAGENIFPPSAGAFRTDIAHSVVHPLLAFIQRTNSYLFVNAYTYYAWSADHTAVPLPYALLETKNFRYHDAGTGLAYTNLLDHMLDAVVAAVCRADHCGVRLALAGTGWPHAGDPDEFGASVRNAATYNRNLARLLHSGAGTPRRPGMHMPAFMSSLFDEDLKVGAGTERHWGLFGTDGSAVYEIDLSGHRASGSYPPLPQATGQLLRCSLRTVTVEEQVAAEEEAALLDPLRRIRSPLTRGMVRGRGAASTVETAFERGHGSRG